MVGIHLRIAINLPCVDSEQRGAPDVLFFLDDIVEHDLFGRGRVIQITEQSTARIEFFKDSCTRDFSLAHAPIRKLLQNPQPINPRKNSNKFSGKPALPSETLLKMLDYVQKKNGVPESFFGGYQIEEDITKADLISYTKKYGFKHLQELRNSLRALFTYPTGCSPPTFQVDVLDIGCAHGLSRYLLLEFGIIAATYSGVDHAKNCLWLAKEINENFTNFSLSPSLFRKVPPQIGGQFVANITELQKSELVGFVIMNHVQNQISVSESTLGIWAEQLKRIYPCGFNILSVEPSSPEYREKAELFATNLRQSGVRIHKWISLKVDGEFNNNQKAVNYWMCGI